MGELPLSVYMYGSGLVPQDGHDRDMEGTIGLLTANPSNMLAARIG